MPSFQAGPAEQTRLLPVSFSLQWQAWPVGSLLRGSPSLQTKVLAGRGTPPGPPLRATMGTRRPEAQRASALTGCQKTLATRDHVRVCHPNCPPLARCSLPNPPGPPAPSPRTPFPAFSLRELCVLGPEGARPRAQPFPPRPGPPFPPEPAD